MTELKLSSRIDSSIAFVVYLVLGPVKFVAYTEDHPAVVEQHLVDHDLYADDTQLSEHPSIACGDSSVVTCWTVDQEVLGSNSTHGRKKNFCRALALWVHSAHSVNLLPAFGAGVLHMELGLKIQVYVLR